MENSTAKRDFEQAIKFLSFSYLLLTMAGFVYYFAYYQSFGIALTEYIDIGEVLLVFTPFLNSFKILLLILSLVVSFTMRQGYLNAIREFSGDENRKRKYVKFNLFVFTAFISLTIFSAIIPQMRQFVFTFLGSTTLYVVIILEMIYEVSKKRNFIIPNFTREIVIVALCFIQFIVAGNSDDRKLKPQKEGKIKYAMTFKDSVKSILTDSNLVYLGRTRNFIFLRDISNKINRIIKSEDVKEIFIMQK